MNILYSVAFRSDPEPGTGHWITLQRSKKAERDAYQLPWQNADLPKSVSVGPPAVSVMGPHQTVSPAFVQLKPTVDFNTPKQQGELLMPVSSIVCEEVGFTPLTIGSKLAIYQWAQHSTQPRGTLIDPVDLKLVSAIRGADQPDDVQYIEETMTANADLADLIITAMRYTVQTLHPAIVRDKDILCLHIPLDLPGAQDDVKAGVQRAHTLRLMTHKFLDLVRVEVEWGPAKMHFKVRNQVIVNIVRQGKPTEQQLHIILETY